MKQAVRRNIDRFPNDFTLELTKKEQNFLRSQFVVLKSGQHSKYTPFAFIEIGIVAFILHELRLSEIIIIMVTHDKIKRI